MKEKLMKEIFSLAKVFESSKRILILELLSEGPAGYGNIIEWFTRHKIPIGSSEVYKHLKLLKDNEMIVKKEKRYPKYTITLRGMVAVKKLKEIANTEPKVPKIRMDF